MTSHPTLARGHQDARGDPKDFDARGVLLLDIEPATALLFEAWLTDDGHPVWRDHAPAPAIGLIVIELAFPRQGGRQRLEQLHDHWPGVAIVVLSPTFLVGVPPQGAVSQQLGAAAVLPAPVARETLRAAVNRLLRNTA